MRLRGIITGLLLAGMAAPAAAQQWSGEGELGLSATSGNTDTQHLNARLGLEREQGRWTHGGSLEVLRESEGGETSAERYLVNLRTAYDWSERNYAFGVLRYDDDRFSGYDYQGSITAGAGRHFIRTERTVLDIEGGLGYRFSETESGATEEEPVARGNLHYTHRLTDTTSVLEDFLVEAGAENTHVESATGLKVAINSKLAMKLAVTVKYNSEVEDDRENTDTISSVNLVYGF